MEKLYFINPESHEGINTTVRRGVKWNLLVEFGDWFEIRNTSTDEKHGEAKILRTEVYRFCDLPEVVLAKEHDSDCRTPEGLLRAMVRAYPTFHEREIVTVIYFDTP